MLRSRAGRASRRQASHAAGLGCSWPLTRSGSCRGGEVQAGGGGQGWGQGRGMGRGMGRGRGSSRGGRSTYMAWGQEEEEEEEGSELIRAHMRV